MTIQEKTFRILNLKRFTYVLAEMRKRGLNGNSEIYTSLKETIYREAKFLKLTKKVREII